MANVVDLKGQQWCDEPVRCPLYSTTEHADLSRCGMAERLIDGYPCPEQRYKHVFPRPEWCPLPVTVFG